MPGFVILFNEGGYSYRPLDREWEAQRKRQFQEFQDLMSWLRHQNHPKCGKSMAIARRDMYRPRILLDEIASMISEGKSNQPKQTTQPDGPWQVPSGMPRLGPIEEERPPYSTYWDKG